MQRLCGIISRDLINLVKKYLTVKLFKYVNQYQFQECAGVCLCVYVCELALVKKKKKLFNSRDDIWILQLQLHVFFFLSFVLFKLYINRFHAKEPGF